MSFSVIHLTDIHLNDSDNIVTSRTNELIDACRSELAKTDDVIIVISGDISNTGSDSEYEIAFDFISSIQTELNDYLITPVKILSVPGNHDCHHTKRETALRERILNTFKPTESLDSETIQSVISVQNNYFDFAEMFDAHCNRSIYGEYVHQNSNGTSVMFRLINSAWMSEMHEHPGKLIIPTNYLPSGNDTPVDCVITVMHHPENWLHPDNAVLFKENMRSSTDLIIYGHEHNYDNLIMSNDSWRVMEFRGKELQGDKQNESQFAIYEFDDSMQNISHKIFSWNGEYFKLIQNKTTAYLHNTRLSHRQLVANKEFIEKIIEDPGLVIMHHASDNVTLSDIYVWPELEALTYEDSSKPILYIKDQEIKNSILEADLTLIIGDSLYGKSAMSKMLFKSLYLDNVHCVLIDAKDITTSVEKNLWKFIAENVKTEFSEVAAEKFARLNADERVIIVDNFNDLAFKDERRSNILKYLTNYAGKVIVFTNNEMEMHMACSKADFDKGYDIRYYRIKPFGNKKRHEFIKKWYYLKNNYGIDLTIEKRIEKTVRKVNTLLGANRGYIPATPIYMINIIQNIEAIKPTSFSGSQYGFLYDSLINKSLSTIEYQDAGMLNIDINVMCALAFKMLLDKAITFSFDSVKTAAYDVSSEKLVDVDHNKVLNNLKASKLVEEIGANTYRFRYPYIFYYFAGRYIAYNYQKSPVQEQVEYMINHLHIETFANIIIFVCHFNNNEEIIRKVLDKALTLIPNCEPFEFGKHNDVFEKVNNVITNAISESSVGDETQVSENIQKDLEQRDKMGIEDGTVKATTSVNDDSDEDVADINASFQTLDVLGQIIKNYPGDIDGSVKLDIIKQIHCLGMRVVEYFIQLVSSEQEDFIQYIVSQVKEKKNIKDEKDLISKTKIMFSLMMANLTVAMINKVSLALNNPSLSKAIETGFENQDLISQKLILSNLKCNLWKQLNIEELFKLADEFEDNSDLSFASIALKNIVSTYLKFNVCGTEVRSRLCERFKLSQKAAIIASSKHALPPQ